MSVSIPERAGAIREFYKVRTVQCISRVYACMRAGFYNVCNWCGGSG
jgi:hypothetical protein